MPTATDRDFLDMPVSDVRRVTHSGRDHHVVLLREPESGRRLPSGSDVSTPSNWPCVSWAMAPTLPGRSAPT
jgi:hypothetical protein